MDSLPRKLDGRSLYALIKVADQVLEKAGPIDRNDQRNNFPVAVSVQLQWNRIQELKAAVDNARYMLEHVTFEVQPPHQAPDHSKGMAVSSPTDTKRERPLYQDR